MILSMVSLLWAPTTNPGVEADPAGSVVEDCSSCGCEPSVAAVVVSVAGASVLAVAGSVDSFLAGAVVSGTTGGSVTLVFVYFF